MNVNIVVEARVWVLKECRATFPSNRTVPIGAHGIVLAIHKASGGAYVSFYTGAQMWVDIERLTTDPEEVVRTLIMQ